MTYTLHHADAGPGEGRPVPAATAFAAAKHALQGERLVRDPDGRPVLELAGGVWTAPRDGVTAPDPEPEAARPTSPACDVCGAAIPPARLEMNGRVKTCCRACSKEHTARLRRATAARHYQRRKAARDGATAA